MKKEIWRPIHGFEGWYEISSFGRVRSLDRTVYFKNNKGKRTYKGKILKQKYHNGYALVNLNKNKKLSVLYIHRLVAETFLVKQDEKCVVNHIDGVKSNNNVDNLEWTTSRENNIHARKLGLRHDNVEGLLEHVNSIKKAVIAIKDNKIIARADCSRNLALFLLKNGFWKNVNPETAARHIRKAVNTGKPYHNIFFQNLD